MSVANLPIKMPPKMPSFCGCLPQGWVSHLRGLLFGIDEMPRRTKYDDITGKKFGRLTVLGPAGQSKNRSWVSRCVCDCGTEVLVRDASLIAERTKSCGCLLVEARSLNAKQVHKHNTTHGLSRTPEYKAWREMIDRCNNPNSKSYSSYGGRGIRVCERWSKFESFYADIGKRPSCSFSIDRIDNNGNYCPANCRWATSKEQGNNRRTNRLLTIGDETKTLAQWSSVSSTMPRTIAARLSRGWSTREAVFGKCDV